MDMKDLESSPYWPYVRKAVTPAFETQKKESPQNLEYLIEITKSSLDQTEKMFSQDVEPGCIYGGSFFSSKEYMNVLKKAPRESRKLLERKLSNDIDIFTKDPNQFVMGTEILVSNLELVMLHDYGRDNYMGKGKPTVSSAWEEELAEVSARKMEDFKEYLKFEKLEDDYFREIYRGDPLKDLKEKIVHHLADRYADAATTAILKLSRGGMRKKDVEDIGRLMLASNYGLEFDRGRFNAAAEKEFGPEWKKILGRFFSKAVPEYNQAFKDYAGQ
jgi:hypothetical protein